MHDKIIGFRPFGTSTYKLEQFGEDEQTRRWYSRAPTKKREPKLPVVALSGAPPAAQGLYARL